MANTSAVYARIDSTLKENAEGILQQLGISPSSAIQMLYSQIVLTRGLPLDLRLPSHKISAIGGMNRVELNAELQKGIDSLKSGKALSRLREAPPPPFCDTVFPISRYRTLALLPPTKKIPRLRSG